MKHFIFAFLACLAFASCSAFDDDYFADHRSKASEHATDFGLFTAERTERVYYWKMNLGWNGSGDDGQYSTQESGIWVTPHRTYQYNQKMVYNFRF